MAVVHCKVNILLLLMMMLMLMTMKKMMMLMIMNMIIVINIIQMTPPGGQRSHGVDDMCLSASPQALQVSDHHSFYQHH